MNKQKENGMSDPIDTSKRAAAMTESERQAFIAQCRKLASAPSQPVGHLASTASAEERAEWLENYKRSLR
jgi:hypothetical protein